jgi:outer membrane receptor protein involved in Fe transport
MLKTILKTTFSALFFISATGAAFAQKGTIKGTVIDSVTAEPLIGTTILIEGTTIGTIADAGGGFVISNITPGRVVITAQYLGYEMFRRELVVEADKEVAIQIPLHAEGINMGDVVVVARIDSESESVILSGQRRAVAAIQSVGAAEMSRKGIGDARAAVAQVSGISRQEGVKNVFVRGLGDRYNATYLNGFPLPSEDPEYKNIALEFFGSDVIQSIGVNKVFTASTGGDVGGAAIDIVSKELFGDRSLAVGIDGGGNSAALGKGVDFLRQDGVNYLGTSCVTHPSEGRFNFANSLDPESVKLPLNHGYSVAGGRRWHLGEKRDPLTVFAVVSHSTDHSFTDETVRKGTADGDNITLDQTGKRSTISIDQLALANVDFRVDGRYTFTYNFLMVHAGDQYVGEYRGYHYEVNQGTDNGEAFLRRQQNNDNLLLTHQLSTMLNPTDRWQVNLGVSYNTIAGLEPDRRENYLYRLDNGEYRLVAGNRQKRFFSRLDEDDLNLKASVSYRLKKNLPIERSNITLGYRGRRVDDGFRATEYNIGASQGRQDIDDLHLDNVYNDKNLAAGTFTMTRGRENRYDVHKKIHSLYLEATHRLTHRLAANVGFRLDDVFMSVDYDTDARATGSEKIDKQYYLPSVSLRYDVAEKHSLRLGVSKSYTLPQSKEIAPYQYINIGFASEGNPRLRPSDNYNVDLKWDWYPSASELISLGAFYKYIANPIGRVDVGGSAGLLSYNNIGKKADVTGVELEVRKNIVYTTSTTGRFRGNRLSVGVNASYIHSRLDFVAENTPLRQTELEGASPFLVNGDISYNHTWGARVLNLSVVAGWFSPRVHTLGTRGYEDIVEESVTTLSVVSSLKVNDFLTVKLKAGNLLDPKHRLTRGFVTKPGSLTLEEYRKGVDLSLGLSFDF